MPFANAVMAGKNLVRQVMQSVNFVTGVSGWALFKNGNAQFNQVTIRGGTVIGGTSLYYSTATPQANTLVASVSGSAGTDTAGNVYLAGTVTYGPDTFSGSGYVATQTFETQVNFYHATAMNLGWTFEAVIFWDSVSGIALQAPGGGIVLSAGNVTTGQGSLAVRGNGTSGNSLAGGMVLDCSVTDTSTIATGNVVTQTAITAAFATDANHVPTAGTWYTLKVPFNGTWGAQQLIIYADINGTFTQLAVIGAVFVPSTVSGNGVNGWLEMEVEIVTATTCRIHLAGSINNQSLNSGAITNGTSCPISSTVATGVTFAAGDTIGVAVAFAGSAAAQTIQTFGSRFTRRD